MGADASQFTLSFIQTWIPDPTRVPNTFRVIVPHQHNLETTSKICPEVCLLGDLDLVKMTILTITTPVSAQGSWHAGNQG